MWNAPRNFKTRARTYNHYVHRVYRRSYVKTTCAIGKRRYARIQRTTVQLGDLVTRTIQTSVILVYEIDEVLESGDSFIYHLKAYKGARDISNTWDKERDLRPATRRPPLEKVELKSKVRVCDALSYESVLDGRNNIVVDLDGSPVVEYSFMPIGAVRVLHTRILDLGQDKATWRACSPSDKGLRADCRIVSSGTVDMEEKGQEKERDPFAGRRLRFRAENEE